MLAETAWRQIYLVLTRSIDVGRLGINALCHRHHVG
jgi:hypothetical protein